MKFLDIMRAVWADSLDGIVIADADTVIMDVNPAYCRLTGFRRERLIGQRTNVVGSGLTPRRVFDEMWASLDTSGKWVGELINRRPDGSLWVSFLSITRVEAPDGRVAAYVGIARDLTERRHLEDQLRQQSTRLSALLEAIASGVAMFDPDDRCVVVNQNLARLLGCETHELLGRTRAKLAERMAAIFREPDVLLPGESSGTRTVTTREPRPRSFSEYWKPVISADGQALGQIFAFRDITRETEVDRMKSEFIATVSHELRTPMTSVKGALGLLLGGATGPVPEPQQELLTIAQNNVDRLIRLINDILDLSRIESGHLQLRPVPMNLNDAVAAAVRELESVRQQRRLELRTELAADLPLALADPDRIGQVLNNLLGNAYKFSEPGGSVTVRTALVGGELQVEIADNGPGIPPEQLEMIFERFQRATGPASRKAGGTGLGLAIARAIIQEHGGRIWAESEPGRGATFRFTLPPLPSPRRPASQEPRQV